jgi:hypothetical protein
MMKPYFQVDQVDGRIQCVAWYPDPEAGPVPPVVAVLPGIRLLDTPLARDFTREGRRSTEAAYWRDGDEVTPGTVEWVETATLDDARALAWAAAKKSRDEAEGADFEFAGILYQPDVAKITGAVLAALLPIQPPLAPFSIDWTVSDNSVVTLDAEQVMALGLTLTARINRIHQRGRVLRDLINNSATPAEAYGYTWNSLDA